MTTESTQTTFLHRVRRAIGRPEKAATSFDEIFPGTEAAIRNERLTTIDGRSREARMRLADVLMAAAAPLNLSVTVVADTAAAAEAVVSLILEADTEWGGDKSVVGWDHPLVAALDLPQRLRQHDIPFDTPERDEGGVPMDRSGFSEKVEKAFVGVTAADFCVADSATLVMKTRPGEPRAVSLVPSIHVAVIHLDQVLADLTELYTLIEPADAGEEDVVGRCMTFISGPSKTADIELVMVHGAHGPRAMTLIVITG